MRFGRPWLVLPLALLPNAHPALPVGPGVVVVLNKADGEAALVDPSTYEVLAKLPTGKGPHEAAISPDGRRAYATNYGTMEERGHTITVLDLENREVEATWDIGSYERPHGLALSRDGERLWVTSEVAQAAIEVDTATGEITKTWKTRRGATCWCPRRTGGSFTWRTLARGA